MAALSKPCSGIATSSSPMPQPAHFLMMTTVSADPKSPVRKTTRTPTAPKQTHFFKSSIPTIKEGETFYFEYLIFQKTIEAVNSFHSLYKAQRAASKGGPATHAEQDLNRAMLVFACAGLDVLVKQLVKTKLPRLVEVDKAVTEKFKQYVKKGLEKNEKDILNTVALALIDQNPRAMLLREYIASMTEESLQSVEELHRVSSAAGLDLGRIFTNEKRVRAARAKKSCH